MNVYDDFSGEEFEVNKHAIHTPGFTTWDDQDLECTETRCRRCQATFEVVAANYDTRVNHYIAWEDAHRCGAFTLRETTA